MEELLEQDNFLLLRDFLDCNKHITDAYKHRINKSVAEKSPSSSVLFLELLWSGGVNSLPVEILEVLERKEIVEKLDGRVLSSYLHLCEHGMLTCNIGILYSKRYKELLGFVIENNPYEISRTFGMHIRSTPSKQVEEIITMCIKHNSYWLFDRLTPIANITLEQDLLIVEKYRENKNNTIPVLRYLGGSAGYEDFIEDLEEEYTCNVCASKFKK
jgi:hypothetical protein